MKSMDIVLKHIKKDLTNFQFKDKHYLSLLPRFNKMFTYAINPITEELKTKKNKKDIIKQEDYTTFSYFNQSSNQLLNDAVNKEDEQKLISSNQLNKLFKYLFIPVVCLPFTLHFGYAMFDQVAYGKLTHYTFQNFLKQIFIVNAVNTGILTGIKLSDDTNVTESTTQAVLKKVFILFGSFLAINTLVFYPLGFTSFNSIYIALMAGNYTITKGLSTSVPEYSNFLSKFLMIAMGLMLIIVNLNMKDYQKKLTEQGKFEDLVKFYELSSDREFKKVMHSFEEFLSEIDVKVEKTKE